MLVVCYPKADPVLWCLLGFQFLCLLEKVWPLNSLIQFIVYLLFYSYFYARFSFQTKCEKLTWKIQEGNCLKFAKTIETNSATSVEVPNDDHSVESRMNGLGHGLHGIPLINTPFTTQDNHIKVHLAVPQGSAFVPSRPSQGLLHKTITLKSTLQFLKVLRLSHPDPHKVWWIIKTMRSANWQCKFVKNCPIEN